MGRFAATVQDHAQSRDGLPEMIKELSDADRSGAGQGAAGEKHRVAVPGQTMEGKEWRTSSPLIEQNPPVTGKISQSASNRLPADGQEEGRRIKAYFRWADRGAQSAEAATKGGTKCPLVKRGGNGPRRAIFLEKTTLPDAKTAVDAAGGMVAEQRLKSGVAGSQSCGLFFLLLH